MLLDISGHITAEYIVGIYCVSREKDNMTLMTHGHQLYDKSDSINYGVEAYELVGNHSGTSIYGITYKCPVSDNQYVFLTKLAKIPPGIIAFSYKTSWNIEKVFDQVAWHATIADLRRVYAIF